MGASFLNSQLEQTRETKNCVAEKPGHLDYFSRAILVPTMLHGVVVELEWDCGTARLS